MLDFVRRRIQSEHERIAAMLSTYIDGELMAKDRGQVETHVARCDACAEELRTLQYTKALLAEAPMPRIPRSFVVRRADLEAPTDAVPRRPFGLSSRLAYGYLKGATALVTVAFALVVAGDLIAQLGSGGEQLAQAPEREAIVVQEAAVVEKEVEETVEVERIVEKVVEVEKEVVVQVTESVQEIYEVTPTLVVEGTPEKVQVEKEAMPGPTPAPAERSAAPTASPPALEKAESIQTLAVSEAATVQDTAAEDLSTETAAEETYGAGETSMPPPMPTATPPLSPVPSPTLTSPPPATSEPPGTTTVAERESYRSPSALRVAEIGLGILALVLLVATLAIRRQQS